MRLPELFDSVFVSWTFYLSARLLDVLTTAAALAFPVRHHVFEGNLVPRLFMEYYGVGWGNVLHEVASLCGAVLIYMLLREVRGKFRAFRLATPRLVPYTIGVISLVLAANNFFLGCR
jgi:hypothetical protein